MEPNGVATVVGEGSVYFLKTPGLPEVCQPKTELTYLGIYVNRVGTGNTFDFDTWKAGRGSAAYTLNVESGVVTSTQPGGSLY
jgi:hypothetical protein